MGNLEQNAVCTKNGYFKLHMAGNLISVTSGTKFISVFILLVSFSEILGKSLD